MGEFDALFARWDNLLRRLARGPGDEVATDIKTGSAVDEYTAPPGAVWVCSACGKTSAHRIDGAPGSFWDSACFSHAVLCFDDATLKRTPGGRVFDAKAWPRAESDPT